MWRRTFLFFVLGVITSIKGHHPSILGGLLGAAHQHVKGTIEDVASVVSTGISQGLSLNLQIGSSAAFRPPAPPPPPKPDNYEVIIIVEDQNNGNHNQGPPHGHHHNKPPFNQPGPHRPDNGNPPHYGQGNRPSYGSQTQGQPAQIPPSPGPEYQGFKPEPSYPSQPSGQQNKPSYNPNNNITPLNNQGFQTNPIQPPVPSNNPENNNVKPTYDQPQQPGNNNVAPQPIDKPIQGYGKPFPPGYNYGQTKTTEAANTEPAIPSSFPTSGYGAPPQTNDPTNIYKPVDETDQGQLKPFDNLKKDATTKTPLDEQPLYVPLSTDDNGEKLYVNAPKRETDKGDEEFPIDIRFKE